MSAASLAELLVEYDRARAYTRDLWSDLSEDEVRWRPHANASAIGWHLGHQPAVAHFMVRNLTAAEASLDAELDALMDAATVWAPETAHTSCDLLILVDEPAEAVVSLDLVDFGCCATGVVGGAACPGWGVAGDRCSGVRCGDGGRPGWVWRGGPAAGDELSVPAQDRGRGDQQARGRLA